MNIKNILPMAIGAVGAGMVADGYRRDSKNEMVAGAVALLLVAGYFAYANRRLASVGTKSEFYATAKHYPAKFGFYEYKDGTLLINSDIPTMRLDAFQVKTHRQYIDLLKEKYPEVNNIWKKGDELRLLSVEDKPDTYILKNLERNSEMQVKMASFHDGLSVNHPMLKIKSSKDCGNHSHFKLSDGSEWTAKVHIDGKTHHVFVNKSDCKGKEFRLFTWKTNFVAKMDVAPKQVV